MVEEPMFPKGVGQGLTASVLLPFSSRTNRSLTAVMPLGLCGADGSVQHDRFVWRNYPTVAVRQGDMKLIKPNQDEVFLSPRNEGDRVAAGNALDPLPAPFAGRVSLMTQPKAKPTTTGTEPGEMAAARREREGGRRRAEILTAARKILQEEGIVALSMLRLAKVA